ncbi:MAG: hypothetical protein AAFZ15_08945 [Bacteroidota bacterium]
MNSNSYESNFISNGNTTSEPVLSKNFLNREKESKATIHPALHNGTSVADKIKVLPSQQPTESPSAKTLHHDELHFPLQSL